MTQDAEDARLEALLLEGLTSESIELTPEFWRQLKTDAARLAEAHKARRHGA